MSSPKKISWAVLLIVALIIKIFSFFPAQVERYYSNGLYPYIATTQRILFGWIPFSIGDLLYLVVAVYWLRKLFVFIAAHFRKRDFKQFWFVAFKQVIYLALIIYISFNLLWGLNYNRLPMELQMELSLDSYSTGDLKEVLQDLSGKLDVFDSTARDYRAGLSKKKTLFQIAVETYKSAGQELPILRYRFPSVKPSLYSYLGNYLGFTGYYNPFTGEAQSNTTVPTFVQPFTTCHEIGHQLGYAKENEANFAGFLSARLSINPAFKYSVYFDMYSYSIREMFRRDSSTAQQMFKALRPGIKDDFVTMKKFYKRYENPLEPIIRELYGNFLKANQQPSGMKSYNEVVAMLVGYRKKFGGI